MIEFLEHTLAVANPVAIAVCVVVGFMIGAFYGYMLAPDKPPIYPFALWSVGIIFITVLGVLGLQARPDIPTVPFSVARAVLWTFLCSSIPLGRATRHWWDLRIIRKRLKALKDELRE